MKITLLQAKFSNHAKECLAERFTVSESEVLVNLNYRRLGVVLGHAPFDKNLYHKMLWSLDDDQPVIIIQDIASGTIITFLTLELYLNKHPGQVKIIEKN